jgi:hypothetical protein
MAPCGYAAQRLVAQPLGRFRFIDTILAGIKKSNIAFAL